jgi:hypothetical protein
MSETPDRVPRSIDVVACGQPVTVEVLAGWKDIGAVTTAARWQAGYGSTPSGLFETRDENGTLLEPQAPIGPWLRARTLHVSLRPGTGA